MTETKRSAKALRILAALLLMAAMMTGAFTAMIRSHAATNEEYCYNYLVNTMGLNTAAASGLLANFAEESQFDPNISGDSGSSYGLCQWNKTRKSSLISYCNSNGLDYTSLNGQLSYLYYELQNEYPNLLGTLRSTSNSSDGAYNAGYRFCYDYERPAAKESKSQSRGSSASRTYYPKYVSTASTSSSPAPASTNAPTTAGTYVVSTGGSNLNLRSEPSADSAVVAKVTDGTQVYVSEVSNGWGLTTVGGVSGRVSMNYLKAA